MSEKRDLNLAIARIEKSNDVMEMATECINALVAERDAMAAKIAALEADRDALRADAQRYEWLREPDIWEDSAVYVRMANGNILAMSDLDNYIDAAIAAKGAQS